MSAFGNRLRRALVVLLDPDTTADSGRPIEPRSSGYTNTLSALSPGSADSLSDLTLSAHGRVALTAAQHVPTAFDGSCDVCGRTVLAGVGFRAHRVDWPVDPFTGQKRAPLVCSGCLDRRAELIASATVEPAEPATVEAVRITCIGCGQLTERHRSGRCASCRRAYDRARDSKPARRATKVKYRHPAFVRAGEAWRASIAERDAVCGRARFGECLEPSPVIPAGTHRGHGGWQLDHLPDGSTEPAHARCNEAAGGVVGNQRKAARHDQ